MSTQVAQTDGGSSGKHSDVEAAYQAVGDALRALSLTDRREQWFALQAQYFDLKAATLARDDDHQQVDLGGTNVSVPSDRTVIGDNPTVQDDLGEVELPTRQAGFRVLDGMYVADPVNPHTTHAVTVDHVIGTDGDVRLEVNGVSLEEVGRKQGSHIR